MRNIFRSLNPFKRKQDVQNTVSWQEFFLDDHNFKWPYATTESGEFISADTAMRVTTVFACTRLLSDTIAQIPVKLLNVEEDGDKFQAKSDPLYSVLLYSPNKWQTAFDYWKWNANCLLFRGWFISKIVRSRNGKIVALIPIQPDSVEIKQLADGSLVFSGMGLVGSNKTLKIDNLPQKDAFFSVYATMDGLTPMSPIKYNAETIGLASLATKHGARFLKNDATPPIVIQYPNKVDADSLKIMAEYWLKRSGGKNVGTPRVVDHGAKVDKLSISNQDAQYLELRQFQKEEICGIFGVPTHMISDTKQAKGWSTVEQQGIDFVTYTITPWTRRIEQAIRKCLIPRSEWKKKEALFMTNALMRGDARSRVEYYSKLKLNGVINANEIRQLENMNLRTDSSANEYWKPSNYELDPSENTGKEEGNSDEQKGK
jgi:HK97 family phage portal protein